MNTILMMLMLAVLAICLTPVFLIGLALAKHAVMRKHERFIWRLAVANAALRTREILTLPARLWVRFTLWISIRGSAGASLRRRMRFANSLTSGVHEGGVLNKYLDAAVTQRNLLFKTGSDGDHIAVAGVTDLPLGTVIDLGSAAEVTAGKLVSVQTLGRGRATKKLVAGEAITAFTHVYVGAGGKAFTTGLRPVGIALEDASGADVEFEVLDIAFFRGTGLLSLIAGAVAAAGSTVADAAALGSAAVVRISSDSAAKGVKLPTGIAGMRIEVINTSATAAKIYAATGGTVNGGAANAAVSILASKGAVCFCTAADTWTIFDMPALSA